MDQDKPAVNCKLLEEKLETGIPCLTKLGKTDVERNTTGYITNT